MDSGIKKVKHICYIEHISRQYYFILNYKAIINKDI